MTQGKEDDHVTIYSKILLSFGTGMLRFWGAEAATSRLSLAWMSFNFEKEMSISDNPFRECLEQLAKIPKESFDSYTYIEDISHLVYATTLLDSFLYDTTLFLLLKFPRTMSVNRQVSFDTVLSAQSVFAVINETASKKAREVAFSTFIERLDYLNEKFGLEIKLDKDTKKALIHYPSIRNTAVHDQGVFALSLNDKGELTSSQKTCIKHPTRVSAEDVSSAVKCYGAVVKLVAEAIFFKVLKVEEHQSLSLLR